MLREIGSVHKIVLVCTAMVVPVMLYNCSSWAVTTTPLHKLDASTEAICDRYWACAGLNGLYPTKICTYAVAQDRCGTGPLWHRSAVAQDRCHSKYGGCVDPCSAMCCCVEDTPAQLSMQFAVAGSNRYSGRVGRHTTNLFDVLRSGLKEKGVKLRLRRYFVRLRELATNRTRWRGLWGGLIATLRCPQTIYIVGTV